MFPNPKDDLLTSYLLGDLLPEQEENSVDDLLFRSDEYLDRLSMLEDELIESYLRNELPEKSRALMEQRLRISPRLRARVALVKRHMAFAADARERVSEPLPGGPQTAISWWASVQKAWQRHSVAGAVFALLGLLAFVASGIWILAHRNGTRELQESLAQQRQTRRELTNQLENERRRREALDQEIAQLHAGPLLGITPLVLTPADEVQTGQRRGAGKAVEVLAQAGILQLQMAPRIMSYAVYRGVIETAEGEQVISQNGLATSGINENRYVVWNLSSAGLRPNDYVVSLYGIASNGKHVLVGEFSFRLKKSAPSS